MEKNQKKALIILTRVPYPEIDGTRKRIMEDVIKGVSEDFSLDLLVVGDESLSQESREMLFRYFQDIRIFTYNKCLLYLRAIKSFLTGRPLQVEYYFNKKVLRHIKDNLDKYDVIYVHTLRLGRYIESLANNTTKKVFLDLNDAISLNYRDAKNLAAFPWNTIYLFEEKRVRRYEKKLLSLVNHTNVVSKYDEDYLKDLYREADIPQPEFFGICPGVEIGEAHPVTEKRKQIAFFGNIKYPPNRDAAVYFVSKIFPLLQEIDKEIVFVIAGNGSEGLEIPNSLNIKKLGFVESLSDFFSNTRLLVAPIRFGAGVPTKILDSLSYGVPVVTSPIGARGLNMGSGVGIGVKTLELDEKAWVGYISELISNSDELQTMSDSAISYIRENYLHEITRDKYRKAFRSISG